MQSHLHSVKPRHQSYPCNVLSYTCAWLMEHFGIRALEVTILLPRSEFHKYFQMWTVLTFQVCFHLCSLMTTYRHLMWLCVIAKILWNFHFKWKTACFVLYCIQCQTALLRYTKNLSNLSHIQWQKEYFVYFVLCISF